MHIFISHTITYKKQFSYSFALLIENIRCRARGPQVSVIKHIFLLKHGFSYFLYIDICTDYIPTLYILYLCHIYWISVSYACIEYVYVCIYPYVREYRVLQTKHGSTEDEQFSCLEVLERNKEMPCCFLTVPYFPDLFKGSNKMDAQPPVTFTLRHVFC